MPRMGVMVSMLRQRECEAAECEAMSAQQVASLAAEGFVPEVVADVPVEPAILTMQGLAAAVVSLSNDVAMLTGMFNDMAIRAAKPRTTPKPRAKEAAKKKATAKRAGARRR